MRPSASRVVAGVAAGLLLGMLAVPASAKVGTTVTVFRAFTAAGEPTLPTKSVSGYCWTGSLAADRSDAWRCFVGNAIHDPCFSSAAARGVVLCPNEQLSADVEIRLTRPLPLQQADRGTPSLHSRPWLIELNAVTGTPSVKVVCEFTTGASEIASGVRLNYFCSGGAFSGMGLWGLPVREDPEWFIAMAPASARNLAHASRVGIEQVWM